jgi:hypothetical protein
VIRYLYSLLKYHHQSKTGTRTREGWGWKITDITDHTDRAFNFISVETGAFHVDHGGDVVRPF